MKNDHRYLQQHLQNSTLYSSSIYYVTRSRYVAVIPTLRPGQYIVRTILDGIYKVATEVTLKGTVRDVNVVIPANIFVSKLSFFFL